MTFRSVALLLSFFTIAFVSRAQREFVPGYVVTNAGDTLSGLIEQSEKAVDLTPSTINFKASSQSQVTAYTVSDLRAFSRGSENPYERFTVTLSMDPVELRKVMGYDIPAPETKPTFLKVLQKGKVMNLYSYRDELKIRFYELDDQHDVPQELVYRLIKVGPNYQEGFEFRKLLKYMASRQGVLDDDLEYKIDHCPYSESPLIRIVGEINGAKRVVDHPKSNSTGLVVGAGSGYSWIRYHNSSNADYSKNGEPDSEPVYWGMIGYDQATNPYVGAFVFRLEMDYSVVNHTIKTFDDLPSAVLDLTHQFKQTNLTLGVGAIGYIVNNKRLRFYVGCSVFVSHASYDNNFDLERVDKGNNTSTQIRLRTEIPRPLWISFPFRVGFVIHEKVEIALTNTIVANAMNQGFYPVKFSLPEMRGGLLYHF